MSSLAELRAEIDGARARLLAPVRTITHDVLTRRPPRAPTPDDARWPIRDVLWHVLDAETRWRRWIEQELGGPPMGTTVRSPRPAAIETRQDLLAAFRAERARTLAAIERLGQMDAALLDRARVAPRDYVHSIRDAIAHLAAHDREHLCQVRALLRDR